MSDRFHLLAPAGEVLIAAYEGEENYIFKAPAVSRDAGSSAMRAFKLSFDVEKATDFDANDYLKIETSPDGGTTWCKLPAAYDDADGANFLDGKGGDAAAFEAVIYLMPGQLARLTANAGLTLNTVGISY